MKQFGDVVRYIGVDGIRRNTLVIGVRTEPENRQGTNGEPLLSLGYFTPGVVFGTADPIILHDVPHVSVEKVIPGVGRWEELEAPKELAAAAEVHPEGWKQST
jgi:hypothetical protein